MDQLDIPSRQIWHQRQSWFEDLFDVERRGGCYIMSEHATGLLVELQSVYCAGAFITCIILSCAIIDAHLRDAERYEVRGMKEVFSFSDHKKELEWLRKSRNRLVHFSESDSLATSIDQHWKNRKIHEAEAKRAVV